MKTSMKPVSLSGIDANQISALSHEWREPDWVLELRLRALDNYNALPWPNEKDERWRRAHLEKLDWSDFRLSASFSGGSAAEIPEDVREREISWISLEEAIRTEANRIRAAWSDAIDRASHNKFLSLTLALGNAGGC